MDKLNENKRLQMMAVGIWLRGLRENYKQGIPDDMVISEKAAAAFMKFCEALGGAVCQMITDIGDDDDGVLYALIQAGQLNGVRAGLISDPCPGCSLHMLVDATQAMISAFHAAVQSMEAKREKASERAEQEYADAILGPIH